MDTTESDALVIIIVPLNWILFTSCGLNPLNPPLLGLGNISTTADPSLLKISRQTSPISSLSLYPCQQLSFVSWCGLNLSCPDFSSAMNLPPILSTVLRNSLNSRYLDSLNYSSFQTRSGFSLNSGKTFTKPPRGLSWVANSPWLMTLLRLEPQ